MRRVVVTGLGVVSAGGIGVDSHWQSLVTGRSAVARSERLAGFGFPIDVAAEIPAESLREPLVSFPKKQLKLFSRVTLFGMIGSSLALEQAGVSSGSVDPVRFGVFLGTFFTSLPFPIFFRWMEQAEGQNNGGAFDLSKANAYCMTSINPMDFSLKTMPNLSAGHMAIAHNAQGCCRVIADGCVGGLQAVGQAFHAIREDHLDIALCGGAETPLEEFVFVNFCTMDFLASGSESPEKTCCPFDAARRGAVLGEGSGMLVLEEYEHARRRGARMYGEILGFGAAAGGVFASTQSQAGEIAERVRFSMRSALAAAAVERVDVIFANGDSTRLHDLAESRAIKATFGPAANHIPVSATKPMHGHLLSASGPVELIGCLYALEKGIIPPTINLKNPDPECELDHVIGPARDLPELKTALVNAVGLFGESASILVGRANGK